VSLTAGQSAFIARLSRDTGLDPGVVTAWALAEESGSAAAARQTSGNHDWLNIGYTDSGTFGAGARVWRDPITAADATAGWLKGGATIPGYGTAAPGIRAILTTAGQPPAAQIAAIQRSGWASSGYPNLPAIFGQSARLAPAPSSTAGAAASSSSSSGAYGGLGGFMLRTALTFGLLIAGLALAWEGFNGLLGGRPNRAASRAAVVALA
jgi:hypothetical protein